MANWEPFTGQTFSDTGCVISRRCQDCPLVVCRHDEDDAGDGIYRAIYKTLQQGHVSHEVVRLAEKYHVRLDGKIDRRPHGPRLVSQQLEKIKKMRDAGYSHQQIGDEMGLARTTIQKAAMRIEKTGLLR